MTPWSRNLPVSSTTAILQPVRRPGSTTDHAQRAGRRRQQQVLQILAEHANCFGIRAFLQLQPNFGLDREVEKPLPGVLNCRFEFRRPVAGRS